MVGWSPTLFHPKNRPQEHDHETVERKGVGPRLGTREAKDLDAEYRVTALGKRSKEAAMITAIYARKSTEQDPEERRP